MPTSRVQASFLAAMAEFAAEGRGGEDDGSVVGADLRTYGPTWHDPAVFAEYVDATVAAGDAERRPPGALPVSHLWWVEGDEYLGRISVRQRDSDWVLNHGGHFGYDVRPSARRRGHATAMLRAAMPVARGFGLTRAFANCVPGNTGSRRVIEAVGGVLVGEGDDGILLHRIELD